jgi:hypothetical protein
VTIDLAFSWIVSAAMIALATSMGVAVGYRLGRRSNVDRAVDRVLAKETRLPVITDQSAADRGEATDG